MTDEVKPMVSIPVGRDVRRRIEKVREPGETDNDVVARLIDHAEGAGIFKRQAEPFSAGLSAQFGPGPGGKFPEALINRTARDVEQVLDEMPIADRAEALRHLEAGAFTIENATDKQAEEVSTQFTAAVTSALKYMQPDQRGRFLEALRRDRAKAGAIASPILDKEIDRLEQSLAGARRDIKDLEAERALAEVTEKARAELAALSLNPRLEKLGESGFHKVLEAWRTKEIICYYTADRDDLADLLERNPNSANNVFVVQHDWAAAFQNAHDFAEGEFRLPYADCVFEFRMSGRRVCVSVHSDDGAATLGVIEIETSIGWVFAGMYRIANGVWNPIINDMTMIDTVKELATKQIRAIVIALEAEVAVTEVVRAPHRLNAKRERAGKTPLLDYHTVNLANRKRHAPRPLQPGETPDDRRSPRLHFVRGHWRHFATSKTWIKWHLRGDPDFGFIDKSYRL